MIQPSGASATGKISCHVGSTRPIVDGQSGRLDFQVLGDLRKGRYQASDNEVILSFEVTPIAPVAQHGERVLPAGM